jgi:2-keto-4-pentenoate hydratase/2-oxohepta-3-ene-1,7-dioic acid hydratase in catechol pathway
VTQWIRYSVGSSAGFGTLAGEIIHVHKGEMFAHSEPTGATLPLGAIRVEMPCVPGKMIALWNNSYAVAAAQGLEIPQEPLFFIKPANSYAGQDSVVEHSAAVGRILYEGELGIIIGKHCRDASIDDAQAAIFGYTCVNDLTAQIFLQAEAGFIHWTRAKGLDGFAPFGPVITTGMDPAGLTIRTRVNGRERQSYSVSDLIIRPARLVSLISRGMTLLPGDLIACGTSTGVGLLPKDGIVEVEIDGIGVLRTRCRQAQ